jgi:hypothetical protein
MGFNRFHIAPVFSWVRVLDVDVVCPFVLFPLAIVLSVLLRFTDYDYPFGILDLQIMITPLVS